MPPFLNRSEEIHRLALLLTLGVSLKPLPLPSLIMTLSPTPYHMRSPFNYFFSPILFQMLLSKHSSPWSTKGCDYTEFKAENPIYYKYLQKFRKIDIVYKMGKRGQRDTAWRQQVSYLKETDRYFYNF